MKPSNKKPSAQEFGQLRDKLAQQGASQSQISGAIGDNINNRTRQGIVDSLKQWLRNSS